MRITPEQADELLQNDLTVVSNHLSAIIPPSVTLTQDQFDALVSLCYNLAGGPNALPKKAPKLWQDLLDGEKALAATEFLDMDHAIVSGLSVELPGLKRRRIVESNLFMSQPWDLFIGGSACPT